MTSKTENQSPLQGDGRELPLGETWQSRGAALVKGGLGAVPIAGGLLGELFGVVVPNQRLDRIEIFIRHLDGRLSEISEAQRELLHSTPEYVDLLEEGAIKAARTIDEHRLKTMADIVADGLTVDRASARDRKRILQAYADLSGDELAALVFIERSVRDGRLVRPSIVRQQIHGEGRGSATLTDQTVTIDLPFTGFDSFRTAALPLMRYGFIDPASAFGALVLTVTERLFDFLQVVPTRGLHNPSPPPS